MTLLAYQIFATAAQLLSFQQTAEQLNLTPSAISHSISTLEKELGFPLFYRRKNKISLTSYGEALLPQIHIILQNDTLLHQMVSEMHGLQKGHVKLGCFNSICMRWIPQIVTTFKQLYPGIEIELFQGTYDAICTWLQDGTIDLGFLSVSSAGILPIHPLYHDRLICVVPKTFKAQHAHYITLPELVKYNLVQPMENCDADSQKLLLDFGLSPKSQCHVVDDLSILTMVEAGFGICILPEMVAKGFSFQVDLYPIEPAAYRVIGLSYNETALLLPAVKKLYEFIIQNYDETLKPSVHNAAKP